MTTRSDQLAILTKALGVISSLVSTLQTSDIPANIYTNSYTDDLHSNMKHYTSTNRPGESVQHKLVVEAPVPSPSQSA